jgi:hypothetical protein
LFCGSDGKGRKYNCFGLARSVIEEMDVSGTGKTNYAFTGESFDPQTGNKKDPEWGLFMHSGAGGMREYHPLNGDPRGQQKRP